MPLELLERIILVSSNEEDLVLDPFAGSGTTLIAAKTHNRRYIGVEFSEDYCKIIKKRLEKTICKITKNEKKLNDFVDI